MPSGVAVQNATAMWGEPKAKANLKLLIGNVSGNRCESDCRSKGRRFDPSLVPNFCGD